MSKFTKTKWSIATETQTTHDSVVCSGRTTIAIIPHQNGTVEGLANAKLIASAPKMAKALEELVKFVESQYDGNPKAAAYKLALEALEEAGVA